MSVAVIEAYGIFEADESPYKATAIKAVQDMNLDGKNYFEKANEVLEILQDKHPEHDWCSICFFKIGPSHLKSSSCLKLKRNDFYFEIVAVHGKAKFDQLTKDKANLEAALQQEKNGHVNTKNQLSDAASKLADAQNRLLDEQAKIKVAHENTKNQLADAQTKLHIEQELKDAHENTKKKLADAQTKLVAEQAKINDALVECQKNKQLLKSACETIAERDSQLDTANKIIRYQENEIAEAEQTLKRKKDAYMLKDFQLIDTQSKLETANYTLLQANQDRIQAQADIIKQVAVLEAQLQDKDEKLEIAIKQLKDANNTLLSSYKKINQFQNDLQVAKIDLDQAKQTISQLQTGQDQNGMNDTQKQFIKILSTHYNQVKDAPISEDKLNQSLQGCTKEVITLVISQCNEQMKNKVPEQLQKLLHVAKNFDAEKINELTADLRIKIEKNTQAIQKHLKMIEDNKNDPDYEDMIYLLKNKVKAINEDSLNLEQQEHSIIKKFNDKIKNILSGLDSHLEIILQECNQDSELYVNFQVQKLQGSKYLHPQEEEFKITPNYKN